MSARASLIDELERAIASRDIGLRADILRRVTDLFAAGSGKLSHDQVALFDSVMGRLVAEIESSARAAFGRRVADLGQAPPTVLRTLALDDAIDVAGPVLAQSEALDDATLVDGARTKSQDHLLAISRRRSISEAVTDVLVERGNRQVALSTTKNPGARFSEHGFSTLVRRSEADGRLAVSVWLRPDIPRDHLLRLFAAASEAVRAELVSADRRRASVVQEMIAKASDLLQAEARAWSPDYGAALERVRELERAGELGEARLCAFAETGAFDHAAVMLSFMCGLPIGAVERAIVHEQSDQLLLIAKAIGLGWHTTKALLLIGAQTRPRSAHHLAQCQRHFERLQVGTARKVIEFYRLRERATSQTTH